MAIPGSPGQSPDRRDDGDAPTWVRSCSRIGLAANPPRPRLKNLLRRR